MVLNTGSVVSGLYCPTLASIMALPGFGDKWSPPLPLDPPGTPATLRAQSHLLAARARADGSIVAGLSDTYVAKCPEVGAWLFGGASDRPPVGKLTDIGLVYRADFDGQPASALALHGECLLSQVTVGPYVMGTVLDAHEGHPFVPLGAAVCGIPFEDVCRRRRFAVDLSAACLDYVEAAFMVDGRVLVHERRVVLTETSQFFHEAIRWCNSAGPIAEAPPRSACLAQLLMRCWERSEVCLDCNSSGRAVRQPCPHKVATVRGLPMLTFDQWCGSAKALALAGTSSFELQQYAAAILAVSPEDPAHSDIATSETGVVAALPPVGYRYSFHRSDDALSFFSEPMRRSILGGGDQPSADSLRLGTPVYQATVAVASEAAALAAGSSEEEDEAHRRSQAHRLISQLSEALGRLPPGACPAGPPRDSSALPDLVPTVVDLWEGSSAPTAPSGASASSGALTDFAVAATDAADDNGGRSSRSGELSIDGAVAATGGTCGQPLCTAAAIPQALFIGATSLGSNHTATGAPLESPDLERTSITQGAERGDDVALSLSVLPPNSTGLDGLTVEQAECDSTEKAEAVTARCNHRRSSVVAEFDAVAQRTGPLTGRVTRVHGSRLLERGQDAKDVSALTVRPKAETDPFRSALLHFGGSSLHSGSSPSLASPCHVEGSTKVGAARSVGNPSVLPPTLPTGKAIVRVEPLCTSVALRSTSSAATTPPALAEHTTVSRIARERPADAPPRRAKAHPCPLCDAAFASRSDVTRHVTTVHERRRQWPCEYPGCKFTGLQKGHLNTHVAAVHHTERPYVCTECNTTGRPPFRSISRSAVERHVRRVHRGIRPYGCRSCRQAFASRSDLRRHCQRQHGTATLDDGAGGPGKHAGQILRTAVSAQGADAEGEAAATPSRAYAPLPGNGTTTAALNIERPGGSTSTGE